MKIISYLLPLTFFLLLSISASAQTEKPKIKAIRAQLFYESTATFSSDLFSQKDLSLWNTIIGEGSSDGASSSTLVTVEVTGKQVGVGALKVEITATGDKNKLLVRKATDVALYDEKTVFYAAVWLYDTGCVPIKLSARLIGKGANTAIIKKTIPFACGE